MKKIYLALLALTLGVSAQAQRNIKLSIEITTPTIDSNIKTGATVDYVYKFTNISATVADSLQKGDTVWFFDPSSQYDLSTTKFKTISYFIPSGSLPKGSAINLRPSTPIKFADIVTLAEMGTLKYVVAPFTNNKRYVWFTQFADISAPASNIPIATYTPYGDTQQVWINKAPTSIIEYKEVATLNTYPNPAVNQLSFDLAINTSDNATATILDAAGRTVMVKELNAAESRHNLDISAVANGMYMLHVNAGDKVSIAKFNVQK